MKTTLPEYLSTLGDAAAATLLGFKKSRIKSWRLKRRRPTPEDARRIIQKTGGKLGWEEIYPERVTAPAQEEAQDAPAAAP